jgi:diguanylate cyclase (GGDEF)-like protein
VDNVAPDVDDIGISDPATNADALVRMYEAEDTLRAIGAGEIDAFVVRDDADRERVFTLSTADRPYRTFVENMRDGAATLSSNGLVLFANRRLANLLACSRETIVGSPLEQFVVGGLPIGFDEMQGPEGLGVTMEMALRDANGVSVPVLVGCAPLQPGGDQRACLTFTDLTLQKAQDRDLRMAQAALVEQATHDDLTGLPNRTLVVDRIDQALHHASRTGRCTAVLFIDLDHFKYVNDTRGHAAGDSVLRGVAQQLLATVRSMDTVARIGGDEFVVLAPNVGSAMHAADLSVRIVAAIADSTVPKDGGRPVRASVGVSVSVAGARDAEALLREADTAMYAAKARGGGCVDIFDASLGRQVQDRLAAQDILQFALDESRIVVHYQPIVDLGTGSIVGLEALARIAEPDGSILFPAAFIAMAEDTGLVVPLGAQVLRMAGEETRRWRENGDQPSKLTVAVNVSARQLEHRDLTAVVRAMLHDTGLDPSRLHLELTETAVIDLHPDVVQQLVQIRDLGVEIGLDDFGTGYASLTHLRRLPLSFVKIDQTFVQGLTTDEEDDRIVAAVVDLAANLGLRSIAEGVETEAQLHRLRELGCDQAQGYLFARPLPPSELPAAIERGHWVDDARSGRLDRETASAVLAAPRARGPRPRRPWAVEQADRRPAGRLGQEPR